MTLHNEITDPFATLIFTGLAISIGVQEKIAVPMGAGFRFLRR
jgi:hypothetical protein